MKVGMTVSILALNEFAEILQPPARLAALDIGTKTIGIALATPDWQMATPLTTIQRGKWTEDLKALEKALGGHGIKGLIVGLPLNMDETIGPRAQGVKQVVYNIIKAEPKWLDGAVITFVDERLSTSVALDMTSHLSLKHTKNKGALDAMAAKDILERSLNLIQSMEGIDPVKDL